MNLQEFIVECVRCGRTPLEIKDYVLHRYGQNSDAALLAVCVSYIRLLQGVSDCPGTPNIPNCPSGSKREKINTTAPETPNATVTVTLGVGDAILFYNFLRDLTEDADDIPLSVNEVTLLELFCASLERAVAEYDLRVCLCADITRFYDDESVIAVDGAEKRSL